MYIKYRNGKYLYFFSRELQIEIDGYGAILHVTLPKHSLNLILSLKNPI
jgi:hypothetical protein